MAESDSPDEKRIPLTQPLWEAIGNVIGNLATCPKWLEEQVGFTFEQATRLGKLDNARRSEHARPTAVVQVTKEDYLDFLRRQIENNARGAEWSAVLQRRLDALVSYQGQPLIFVSLHCKGNLAYLHLRLDTYALVHAEIY